MSLGALWTIAKETTNDWLKDDASRLAASLAFYTLLSLAPLVIIAVAIAGMALGPEAARGQIAGELSAVVGTSAAQSIQTVVANAQSKSSGTIGTIVGVA